MWPNVPICSWCFSAVFATKATIVASSGQVLESLGSHVSGAGQLLDKAAGVLVFPEVVKVGFGGTDEYGDGCLLVKGNPVAFYSTSGAAYGLPLGVRSKSEVVLFMTPQALKDFRAGPAWQVGVNGASRRSTGKAS